MDFPPILILAVFWLLIGLPLSRLSKAAKQRQNARNSKPGAAKNETKAPQGQPQAAPAAYTSPEPVRPAVLQPTISFTEHDDSIYQGSMNAVTGEGYDPCHDEQLAPLSLAETEMPSVEAAEPGLQLSWTGNEIVRGFVMSEILTRR